MTIKETGGTKVGRVSLDLRVVVSLTSGVVVTPPHKVTLVHQRGSRSVPPRKRYRVRWKSRKPELP